MFTQAKAAMLLLFTVRMSDWAWPPAGYCCWLEDQERDGGKRRGLQPVLLHLTLQALAANV